MVGLIISIIVFNTVAYKENKLLIGSQVAHIWLFTIALQTVFDTYVDLKYHGYWYFSKNVDWESLIALVFLVPPVNVLFINWFPYGKKLAKQILYFIVWEAGLLFYEWLTLSPAPWGYFHYGWWSLWHSLFMNPILLLILMGYYKWISHLDRRVQAR